MALRSVLIENLECKMQCGDSLAIGASELRMFDDWGCRGVCGG
jgi:hypothetical protein